MTGSKKLYQEISMLCLINLRWYTDTWVVYEKSEYTHWFLNQNQMVQQSLIINLLIQLLLIIPRQPVVSVDSPLKPS